MIYEFKSRATGSVVMTKPVAEWILKIVGKTPGATGIVTVDQMPAAIAALRTTVPGPGPDRILAPEIEAAHQLVRSGELVAAARRAGEMTEPGGSR